LYKLTVTLLKFKTVSFRTTKTSERTCQNCVVTLTLQYTRYVRRENIPLHFHQALHQSRCNISSHIKIICQVIRTGVPNVPASVKMAGWN